MKELLRIIELSKEIGELAERILSSNKTPIAELALSNRAMNCLRRGNTEYVEQLLRMTDKDLLRIRNMGRHTLNEIKERIKLFELKYKCLDNPC